MKLVTFEPVDRCAVPTDFRANVLALSFRIAEQIRAAGRQRKIRDLTINMPVDHIAISVIDLACQVLSRGDFSAEAAELDELVSRLMADPPVAARLGSAMSNLADRLLPEGFCAR